MILISMFTNTCLSSSLRDKLTKQAFTFAILNNLE